MMIRKTKGRGVGSNEINEGQTNAVKKFGNAITYI